MAQNKFAASNSDMVLMPQWLHDTLTSKLTGHGSWQNQAPGLKQRSLFTTSSYNLNAPSMIEDSGTLGLEAGHFNQGGYGDLYQDQEHNQASGDSEQAARLALANCLFGSYNDQSYFCQDDQQCFLPPSSHFQPPETPMAPPPGVCLENPYLSPEDIVTSRGSAFVTKWGTLALEMRHGCMMEITCDQSLRIINTTCNIVLALNVTGTTTGMLHPNGRIHQYDSRVEVKVYDHTGGNHKVAKMWYKGVSFTSDKCALVYLVDQAGTRTTTDYFSDLDYDFSQDILFQGAHYGPPAIEECCRQLNSHNYYKTASGTEVWLIGGIKVFQSDKGVIRVTRENNKRILRTSPAVGTASITTPILHATASMGQSPHMFVRRGERRLHTDLASFVARNAGHSAGFDDTGRLKVY